MRSTLLVLIVLVNFFLIQESVAEQSSEASSVPACIGGICLAPNLPELAMLIKQYGRGAKLSHGGDAYYCYTEKEDKAFVKLFVISELPKNVSGVLISKVPTCSSVQNPSKPFKRFFTPEGVSLGDPIEKVLHSYGSPSFVKKGKAMRPWLEIDFATANSRPVFDSMLMYVGNSEDDLLQAIYYIKDGYVAAIKLSVTE